MGVVEEAVVETVMAIGAAVREVRGEVCGWQEVPRCVVETLEERRECLVPIGCDHLAECVVGRGRFVEVTHQDDGVFQAVG